MPLPPGTRIGSYEIVAAIGAGGMGEVYRATDTALGRQVAIKVLPGSVATDPDRLARFEREAKTLAALNHPTIAQIYGLDANFDDGFSPAACSSNDDTSVELCCANGVWSAILCCWRGIEGLTEINHRGTAA
jgi:serine/threonine protein kinase